MSWKSIKSDVKSFRLDKEPEYIHIIKTGFVDCYFVVYEDGYEQCNDMMVEKYTKAEIKAKFNIEL